MHEVWFAGSPTGQSPIDVPVLAEPPAPLDADEPDGPLPLLAALPLEDVEPLPLADDPLPLADDPLPLPLAEEPEAPLPDDTPLAALPVAALPLVEVEPTPETAPPPDDAPPAPAGEEDAPPLPPAPPFPPFMIVRPQAGRTSADARPIQKVSFTVWLLGRSTRRPRER